jgi:chemotaxis protein methyltransferase CheR
MTSPAAALTFAVDITDAEFRYIGDVVHRVAGIYLGPGKKSLVRSRIVKRLRALSIATITQYLEVLKGDHSGTELAAMVDVLTTNKTSFFREIEHFRLLQTTVFPALASGKDPIRIWSAGCSTGEEPYTIAMVARETLGANAGRVRILATDISARVLERARAAEYESDLVDDVASSLKSRHFEIAGDGSGSTVRVVRGTRDLVQFARLNLMSEWPMRGSFNVIFCRNVMIYFDKPTQERLVERYSSLLVPGGHLFVGHSESLTGLQHSLTYVQPATYRR